jgi:hypothetical protein
MLKSITLGMLCAAGISASAHAGPMSVSAPQTTIMVANVASHCWLRNGRQHCSYGRSYGYRSHGYRSTWYPHDASKLRTGSRRWWDQKESEGSAGRP